MQSIIFPFIAAIALTVIIVVIVRYNSTDRKQKRKYASIPKGGKEEEEFWKEIGYIPQLRDGGNERYYQPFMFERYRKAYFGK